MWFSSFRLRPRPNQRLCLFVLVLLCALPASAQDETAPAGSPTVPVPTLPAEPSLRVSPPVDRSALGETAPVKDQTTAPSRVQGQVDPAITATPKRAAVALDAAPWSLAEVWREIVGIAMFLIVLALIWRLDQRLNRLNQREKAIIDSSELDGGVNPVAISASLRDLRVAQGDPRRTAPPDRFNITERRQRKDAGDEWPQLDNHLKALQVQFLDLERKFRELDRRVRHDPTSGDHGAVIEQPPLALTAMAARLPSAAPPSSAPPASSADLPIEDPAEAIAARFQAACQHNDRQALRAMADVELNITAHSEDALARRVGTAVTQLQVVDGGGSFLLIQREGSHWLIPSFQTLAGFSKNQPAKGLFTYKREPAISNAELRRPAKVRDVGGVWEVEAMGVVAVPS